MSVHVRRKGQFFCHVCRTWLSRPDPNATGGTGYGVEGTGYRVEGTGYGVEGTGYGVEGRRKICYACCALRDADRMRKGEPIILYDNERELTNWPGTLRIPLAANATRVGRHNMAKTRIDYWFVAMGHKWHGVCLGDNQIVRCKAVKEDLP